MRISDWSSDVCSSDLLPPALHAGHLRRLRRARRRRPARPGPAHADARLARAQRRALRRSEERRVGKECVRRVDLGGRRNIKKKKKSTQQTKENTNLTHIISAIERDPPNHLNIT